FEIYRFTGGRYHPATVSLKPGEPIGDRKRISTADGGTEEVNFFTGGVLLDVVRVAEGTGLSDEKVRLLVALPDGSILSLNPDEQRENPERVRLREMSSEPPRS